MQNPVYAMGARSLADRPDDFTGAQIHVIYAVPQGATDQQLDVTSRIPYSVAVANKWLQGQIGRKVRFDTYQGDLDVQFVQLPRTDAEYGGTTGDKYFRIRDDLANLFVVPTATKNLLVFYDGTGTSSSCGQSTQTANAAEGYQVSIQYMTGCWSKASAATPDSQPTFFDYEVMHEIFHGLGAGHTPQITQRPPQISSEEYYGLVCDLMYVYAENLCTAGRFLDPLGRFYYNPAGFPDRRVNTYDSAFLTPPAPK